MKELPAIRPPIENLWKSIMRSLSENPDSIVPVILQDPITKIDAGQFYASIVKEEERVYLQVENVTEELGDEFVTKGRDEGWQTKIGGIYWLPISSPLLGP